MAAQMGHGNTFPFSFHLWTFFSMALITLLTQVRCFNLDTTHTLHKLGDRYTFFGFSVALHQQLNPESQSWILVGAPQAAGRGLLKGSRPGALFRCPITPEEYDCERVDIDEDSESQLKESKDNQWLGVTVKSQGIGGKVVTCAHLYELRQRVSQSSETRDPIGRCYVLSDDLTKRDELDGGEWKFCEGRPQGHEQFGFCQQGLSVSFTPDNNFILFGAPGTYNWKGLLFMASAVEDALLYKTLEPSKRPTPFEDVAHNSYLGHIFCLCFLSWTDLIVGAPNFFDRKAEIGGAVYVYLNPFGHWDDQARPIRLNGTYDSMFGMTVSNIGDLDQDGYGDIAVGAPFDGDGKVFIYRGSDSGIETKPAQVDSEIKRFGYSISGGLDIDENQYPDVAIALVVHFEADTERRKLGLPHRMTFLGRSSLEPEYTQTEEVELHRQRHPACITAVFQLFDTQICSLTFVTCLTVKVNFLREGCGSDKICQSNLKLRFQFGTRPHNTDFFTPLPKDEDGVQVLSLSDQRLVVLEITITNLPSDPLYPEEDGDDAHAAQLLITLPNTLSYAGSRVPTQMRCQANQNGSQVECDLGNPVKRNAKLKFTINLSTANITTETTELTADLLLTTISEQSDLDPITAYAKVVIELPLSVSGLARPHQLFFSGTVKGESAMTSLEDIGSPVDLEFVVTNPGKALQTLGSAFLNIMWPNELANGKWLLYPANLTFLGHPDTQCTPAGALNPLKLQSASPAGSSLPADQRDCLLGSARCVLFQCPLHSFTGQAVLKIHARLWNGSFIEEFPSVSALELLVRANITVKSSIKHLVLREAAAQIPVMIYPEPGLADQYWIPWWIILIAILAGILLLTLLVCLLWKCGFFQRGHHKDKLPQYHAVKIPRELRPQFQTEKSGCVHKKEWATHWSDGTL
uniref:Integrin subunit alpha 7 n=1 Tax=Nothobranchius furzeri TaxID=105023 RepID=A0A8C6NP72_NOTFU